MNIKDGKLSGFTICAIETDSTSGAKAIADSELNGILGLIMLHCQEIPPNVRTTGMHELTKSGPVRRRICPRFLLG